MPIRSACEAWAITGTITTAAVMPSTATTSRPRPYASASAANVAITPNQNSQVRAGAGVSSQPKNPIIWWM